MTAASLAGVELKLSNHLERGLRDAAVMVYITYSEGLGSGALLADVGGRARGGEQHGRLAEIIRHGENACWWTIRHQPSPQPSANCSTTPLWRGAWARWRAAP